MIRMAYVLFVHSTTHISSTLYDMATKKRPNRRDHSHPTAESSPTVDQGSRDVVEEPMDLNGDRTQAEPEDEMQLDRGGSTDPGGRKRRRGLFRRGGT